MKAKSSERAPGASTSGAVAVAQSFEQFCARFREIHRRIEKRSVLLARTDSTNALARRFVDRSRAAPQASVSPLTLIAWEQTAGRGRRGNRWRSDRGLGLYLTMVYPRIETHRLQWLPLVGATSVAESVEKRCPGRVRVKWPNDVLIAGKKVAGVLVEAAGGARGEAAEGDQAISAAWVGVGVNCGHDQETLPHEAATSLLIETGGDVDMAKLANEIASRLDEFFEADLDAEGLVERWRSWSAHSVGDPMRCRVGDGVLEGTFAGFSDEGALLLDRNGKIEHLTSAEIVDR